MMPKITLRAPTGVGGQIHASQSGHVYTIAEDGTVTVAAMDVRDLIGVGYRTVAQDGGPNAEPSNVASPDPALATTGQTADSHADEPRQDPPPAA